MFKKLMIINGILLFLIVVMTLTLFYDWKNWNETHNLQILLKKAKAVKPHVEIPSLVKREIGNRGSEIESMANSNIFHKDRNVNIPQSRNPDMEIRLGNPPVIVGISSFGEEKYALVRPKVRTGEISGIVKLKVGDLWLNDWKVAEITDSGLVLSAVNNSDLKHKIDFIRMGRKRGGRKTVASAKGEGIKHKSFFDFKFGKGLMKTASASSKSLKKGGIKVVTGGAKSSVKSSMRSSFMGSRRGGAGGLGRSSFSRNSFGGRMGSYGGRFGSGSYGGMRGGYYNSGYGGNMGGYGNYGGGTYRPRIR